MFQSSWWFVPETENAASQLSLLNSILASHKHININFHFHVICSISVLPSTYSKPNICCLLCCGLLWHRWIETSLITGCKLQSTLSQSLDYVFVQNWAGLRVWERRFFAVKSQVFDYFFYLWIQAVLGNAIVVEDLILLPFGRKHRQMLMVLYWKFFNQLVYWYWFNKDFWHASVLTSFTSFSLITSLVHCLSMLGKLFSAVRAEDNSAVMMRNPRMRSHFGGYLGLGRDQHEQDVFPWGISRIWDHARCHVLAEC